MPDFPSINRVSATLTEGQVKKGIVGKTLDSKTLGGFIKNVGRRVASRLDINAYNNYNTWVVSIHDGSKLKGSPIGYGQTARLKNVEFKSNAEDALDIARGKKYSIKDKKDKPFGKSTIARIFGDWVDDTPEKVYELSKKELDNPNSEWVQIGMNPYKHSYFYDKKTMQPILSADEVIQVGPLVLARNVKRGKASDFTFNKGGVVDMRDGGGVGAVGEAAALMASGGQASNPWESGGWKSKEHYMSTAKKDYGDFKNWSVFAKKMGIVPPTAYVPPFEEARAFSPVLMSGKRIYKGAIVQQDNPLKGGSSRMTKAELSEFQNKGTYKLWQKRLAKQAKSSFKMTKDLVHGTPSKKGDFGYVGTQEKFSGISGDTPTDQRTIIGFKGEGSDPSIPTFGKEARSKIMSGPEYMNRRGITGEYINLNKALQEKPDPFAGELSRVGQESWRTKQERQDFIKQMEAQDLSTPSETVTYAGKRGGVVDMRDGGRVRMKDGGELAPAYIRSFLSDIFTSTDEEIRDESYFDENEQNALLQVVKNSRKRHGENKGSIDYERDYPEGFKGIYYGGSSDLLTKNPFQSVKKTLGGFSWSYDPEKKEYFITDRYNFNDAEKIQKMYPNALNKAVAFAKEIGTRAATGQLGMYGIARTTGKYYGSEEGKGAQFLIRLSDKKKV